MDFSKYDQEDFSLLGAMACGSGQTYYKVQQVVRDDKGKLVLENGKPIPTGEPITVTNKNPESTYGNLMRAMLGLTETPAPDAADALAIGFSHLAAADPLRAHLFRERKYL